MGKMLNQKELCEWLKISRSTAERWRKEGMPFIKIGGRSIRFETDQVTEWMASPKNEQK